MAQSASAFAQEGDCPSVTDSIVTVVNADGSRLQLRFHCEAKDANQDSDTQDSVAADVAYAAPYADAAAFEQRLTLGADPLGDPLHGIYFADIDGDGTYEVVTSGSCGAGPNCWHEIYRLQPSSGVLELLLSDGYSELIYHDGYLVIAGRASCCSWEYHAWHMNERPLPLTDSNMDLMIFVAASTEDEAIEDDAAISPRCTFTQRQEEETWQVIAPPGPDWLSFCEIYGSDYHVVTPSEAPSA
jgi:hypothetical protein